MWRVVEGVRGDLGGLEVDLDGLRGLGGGLEGISGHWRGIWRSWGSREGLRDLEGSVEKGWKGS